MTALGRTIAAAAFLIAACGTACAGAMGPPVIDVRAFGARGDGVSDDTDALRAAFAAVPAAGGTVIVPPGTYLVDPRGGARAMNLVGAHTAVIGAAGASTLKLADRVYAIHDGGMLLRNRDAVRGDAGITLRGLGFDGNDRGNLGRDGRAESLVRCTRCRDLLIEDCRFLDSKYHAIATILGSDVVIRGNRFFRVSQTAHAGDAVQLNGPAGAIASDNVVENGDEGIFCQHENDPATPARDCVIERNRIVNLPPAAACTGAGAPFACCTGRGTGHARCTVDDPSGCLCAAGASTGSAIGVLAFGARVADNVLVRVGQISVQGLRAAGGFPTRDVLVAKNRLLDLAWNARLTGSGGIAIVAADAPVARVTVRDNRVDHTRDAGIRLASGRASLSAVEVGDNVVNATCTAHAPCGGIHLETEDAGARITNVTIARNALDDSRSAAIRVEGPADGVTLVGNDLDEADGLAVSERRGPVRYSIAR
jgi:polygalacturonase